MSFHVLSYEHLSSFARFFEPSFSICILLLLGIQSHTLSLHFLTFLGLCHLHTLSLHLPQWDFGQLIRSPIGQQPEKTTSSPNFSHNGLNSPGPGQAVSHCSELTGGVGGDGVGVGVPLIS